MVYIEKQNKEEIESLLFNITKGDHRVSKFLNESIKKEV